MKRFVLFFIILFLYSLKGYSQNLVPNPSFEDTLPYATCPYTAIQCVPQWFVAGGTPDYWSEVWGGFNCCPSAPYPHTGIAMAGWGGNVYFNPLNTSGWEYIETPLANSLKAGTKYCVNFYVLLDNNSIYGIDCIGAYFSKDSILAPTSPSYSRIDVIPQIENPKYHFLVDTVNWMEISGSFTAQGEEHFITIGNFRPDSLTDTARIKPIFGGSYYYLTDDVSVVAINEDSAIAGNDTTICQGDSVLLGSPAIANYIYSWSPSAGLDDSTKAQPMAKPSVATTYLVRVTTTDTTYAPLCRSSVVIPDSVTITVRDCNPAFTNKLYPNPNNGNFILEYNIQGSGVFNLYDVLGQLVLQQSLVGETGEQNIYALTLGNGIYVWEVVSGSEVPFKGKLVVMK